MKDLFSLVESVAASDVNILIQGENGTGKEVIADVVHDSSNRAAGPFIKINCSAIPTDLIESELFGYKKGAFTGVDADKIGLLEMSEGGSLLLDEIGEIPPYLQAKLLRVLQEREYRPIGSDRLLQVDFRLICATNADLDVALREGKLREDLYFRINTVTLRVPPLRERTDDIPSLYDHFRSVFSARYQKDVCSISPAAYQNLVRNRWAGNVRELENAIERAVLVCETGTIEPVDLPEAVGGEGASAQEFTIPSPPDARGNREDGDPANPAADRLEQTGSRADSRPAPSDALQQDEKARHPGPPRTTARRWSGGTPALGRPRAGSPERVILRRPLSPVAVAPVWLYCGD